MSPFDSAQGDSLVFRRFLLSPFDSAQVDSVDVTRVLLTPFNFLRRPSASLRTANLCLRETMVIGRGEDTDGEQESILIMPRKD